MEGEEVCWGVTSEGTEGRGLPRALCKAGGEGGNAVPPLHMRRLSPSASLPRPALASTRFTFTLRGGSVDVDTSHPPHPTVRTSRIPPPTPFARHHVYIPHPSSQNLRIPHPTSHGTYIPHPTSQNVYVPCPTLSTWSGLNSIKVLDEKKVIGKLFSKNLQFYS